MLARRGLQTRPAPRDLPFPADLADEAADRLSDHLRHYAFRLFLRGAIQKASGFTPEEVTRYLSAAQARALAEAFVRLGLAVEVPEGRYRLHQPARSFGGTLESLLYLELKSSHPSTCRRRRWPPSSTACGRCARISRCSSWIPPCGSRTRSSPCSPVSWGVVSGMRRSNPTGPAGGLGADPPSLRREREARPPGEHRPGHR